MGVGDQAVAAAVAAPLSGAPWRPLLSGQTSEAALRTADALMTAGGHSASAGPARASLSAGTAGLAVCHAMFARAHSDDAAAARAAAFLEDAIGVLARERLMAGLYSGFTGIAWAAELVDVLLARDDGDRNDVIDAALAQVLARPIGEDAPYDLVNGLTGLGVYAIARWPRGAAAECLAAIVSQLLRRARRDGDGVFWWTPPSLLAGPTRQRYPNGGVDLGVAHGIAGVIPLLARAVGLGVVPEIARELLDDAVRWLLARLLGDWSGRTAPAFLAAGEQPGPARTAWCYGDPGVAMALLLAARDVGEPAWERAGRELGLAAAARRFEDTGVVDAGLCHGAAGLAHLFNRMYQLTGEAPFAEAARTWIGRTLAMCEPAVTGAPAAGEAGGLAWNGPGLLEGAAGAALTLLAASTPVAPAWDQMLLVSAGGVGEACPR